MAEMNALVLEAAEGLDAVRLQRCPVPQPGPGHVRVRLAAAGLNHRELWIARGLYPGMSLPCILGADGAGQVDAVGPGVDPALVGLDCVLYPAAGWGDDPRFPDKGFHMLGMPAPGTFAEYLCVSADAIAPRPAHLEAAQAAALPTGGVTAWRALVTKAALAPGEVLLVTGVGGGVAGLALQLGLAMGARVFVTSGSAQTLERAVALGAEGGFDYRESGWHKAFLKASGGANVVFDGAPAGGLSAYARALAPGARVVIYGSTGGQKAEIPVTDLFLRHATIHGTAMGTPDEFRAMLSFVGAKGIVPVIEHRFPLSQGRDALQALAGDHGFGKIVLDI